ncbi:hypothetical protein DYB34_009257 [Aphanomyces astaci]|uniref:N-acetyltransferase domain-containing protein n=1 Tax=Aphanomyces astaci TaxID=112090 RepID=A0A418BQL4_APHAT|nr:hypothetical protein DYB34_009257 [Aphanomyces astaci]
MSTTEGAIQWSCVPFRELSVHTLYDAMQLRSRVFVVEQKCIWVEVDGYDKGCWHVIGTAPDGTIAAYARLVAPLLKGPHQKRPIISRVVVPPEARGTGRGRVLMLKAMDECHKLWPTYGIEIGAQQRLEEFYASLGFKAVSEPYDEDGILHVDMHHDYVKSTVTAL